MPNPTATPQQTPQLAHINPTTQRQHIARNHDISTETLRRWIRFAENCCLDWWRVCPGEKTPRHLHPYQAAIVDWILANRSVGKDWLENALLRDERLTYQAFQQSQTSA